MEPLKKVFSALKRVAPMTLGLVALFVALAAAKVYAQAAAVPVDATIPDAAYLQELFTTLGGLKGLGGLGLAALITQLVMHGLQDQFVANAIHGKWRILLVAGLSIVGGVLALMASGIPLVTALLHATTLAAYSVFFNQLKKQLVDKTS